MRVSTVCGVTFGRVPEFSPESLELFGSSSGVKICGVPSWFEVERYVDNSTTA